MATGRVDRDELLARVPLEQLLTHLSGPPERGRWHCPDVEHPDQHPSVTVAVGGDGTQRWRCWSGGHRGTAIDAVISARRVGVGEAMRWLADHYDTLPPAPAQRPPFRTPAAPAGRPDRAVIDYVERAEALLWTPAGEPQRRWLHQRGLGDGVLRANRIGADPGHQLLARPGGFPRRGPAVVFPALDASGAVTYFQARYLTPPPARGKYDNPARRHATNPRVAWTQPAAAMTPVVGVLVVCEGIPDALVAAQAGAPAVGVLGSSYPDPTLADTIATGAAGRTVVVCFDGDTAGKAGAARLAALLADRHVTHRVLIPPGGADLTDWARTNPNWAERLTTMTTATHPPPAHPPAVAAGSELRIGLGLPSL